MSNKRIDLTQLGGFPLTQDALDFMQSAYQEAIAGLAKLAGDSVIVSGMVDNGASVTDGWILINGELLPFQAGNKQTYFIIVETTDTETFEDDSVKTIYYTRQARFGSGAGQIPYANLVRLSSLKIMQNSISNLAFALNGLANDLAAHETYKDNPHAVTKAQVGLSNIPNAKSDSYSLDDSNTLATSKAVHDAFLSNKIAAVGSKYFGDLSGGDKNFQVLHNGNITGSYVALVVIRSAGTPTDDNDLTYAVYGHSANSFWISLHEVQPNVQNVYIDYVCIKY